MMMHNLTQRSLVLGLKAVCLHSIRWPFRNTMLVQFNDTSEFRKITMQESGDIAQPRPKFPMRACDSVCYWCLRNRNKRARHEIVALSKSGCCGLLFFWIIFSHRANNLLILMQNGSALCFQRAGPGDLSGRIPLN